MNKILNFVEGGHLPDIMNFENGSLNEQKYNNIIYYDENIINYKNVLYKDCDLFERHTSGAFIICANLNSLNLIREEILKQIKRDKRITFNLITTGSQCDKVMKFIKENKEFGNCIKQVCIYCMDIKKWSKLKDDYNIIYNVYNRSEDVINFIKICSSEEIKPFHVTKLITYEDYIHKYKDIHFKISQFYGDLTKESFKKYLENIKRLIKEEEDKKELYNQNQVKLLEGFLTFNLDRDLKELDKLIIKEYTKNTFFGDLNRWLMDSKMNFYEPVAYFTARLMYHFNSFAKENKEYFTKDKYEVYRGVKLYYSSLIPYERAIGKVILIPTFISTTEDEKIAKIFCGRQNSLELYKTTLKFSVIFRIKNCYQSNWISNGISLQNISSYKNEKEVIYQAFSFYKVVDVQIDYQNFIADIYLETIGKTEILEEKIRMNNQIQYNKDKGIMEVLTK